MLLRNTATRLITINGAMNKGVRKVCYQIKPGNNPSVEVPGELCKNAFVKGLIEDGSLEVIKTISADTHSESTSEYDDMSKDDVKAVAEALEIDVKSSWSKTKIIEEIVKLESE